MVFLEDLFTPLLLLHLLATFVLVGAMTHHLFRIIGYARGDFTKQKLELRFLNVSFWSYLIVYGIGMLIYPAFRIYMRQQYFDPELPWATGLFEVKEHWGAIGLALLFCLRLLRKSFAPDKEKEKLYLYIPLCFVLNLILWYKVIVGCVLSMLKGSIS